MWFYWSTRVTVLFHWWTTNTLFEYLLTLLALCLLGISYELLSTYKAAYELSLISASASSASSTSSASSSASSSSSSVDEDHSSSSAFSSASSSASSSSSVSSGSSTCSTVASEREEHCEVDSGDGVDVDIGISADDGVSAEVEEDEGCAGEEEYEDDDDVYVDPSAAPHLAAIRRILAENRARDQLKQTQDTQQLLFSQQILAARERILQRGATLRHQKQTQAKEEHSDQEKVIRAENRSN